MLVIGPNRVFLRYIEQVLPSLGEAGVEQVVLSDLVPDVRFAGRGDQADTPLAARIKGDARMSDVVDNAVRDRQRPLREDVVVPFRSGYVRLRADDTVRIVKQARRRFRRHNAARRWVEGEVWSAMAATWRGGRGVGRPGARRGAGGARDPCGARSHVAGADAGPVAARPVRVDGAAAAGRRRRPRRLRVQGAPPAASRLGRRRALDGGRRRPARRRPRGARAASPPGAASRTTPKRSARSVTS